MSETEREQALVKFWLYIAKELCENPIVNTVIFSTNEKPPKSIKIFSDMLSTMTKRKIVIKVEKPNDKHPEGDIFMAYLAENNDGKPLKFKDLFNKGE